MVDIKILATAVCLFYWLGNQVTYKLHYRKNLQTKANQRPVYETSGATKTFKTAPKLSKDICKIKWNSSAKSITNHIRGLNPFPGAWTTLTNGEINKHFKIFSADISNEIIGLGILKIINNQLYIGCNNGSIRLIEVQIEGKKRMLAEDFIKGNIMINKYYTL